LRQAEPKIGQLTKENEIVQHSIDHVAGTQPMQPAGAALLRLAWRHREALLRR
jgi:hypothetical protein